MASVFGEISILSGTNSVKIQARSGLAANYTLALPNTAPANNQGLKWDSANSCFVWAPNSVGLSSTDSSTIGVTDVGGLGTTYTIGFPSKAAGLFLASPSGGAGTPTFRAIVDADISSFDASKLTGTISPSRIPSGTDASSFQIGVAAGNVKWTADTTKFEARKADNSLADLVVNKITATQVDFTTVNEIPVGDSVITLNADYTGTTPTEDAGIEVERGTQTNFFFGFQESTDRLVAGFVGTVEMVARVIGRTFTSTDVASNTIVWAHNKGTDTVASIVAINPSGQAINVGYTVDSVNQVTVDVAGLTITGTWKLFMVA